MAVDRIRLTGALTAIAANRTEIADLPERLCDVCVSVLPVDGVGLSLMTHHPGGRVLVGASDEAGNQIESLQFSLGEGPCATAFTEARPVLVPDLRAREARMQWPMFIREAEDIGVGALFAFPLQVGAIGFGVLDCHRRRTGPFGEIAEALAVADAVTATLINITAGAEPTVDLFELSWRTHAVVHQATGVLVAQLGIAIADALALLRAYAFRYLVPLDDVAADVLAGRLSLDRGTP